MKSILLCMLFFTLTTCSGEQSKTGNKKTFHHNAMEQSVDKTSVAKPFFTEAWNKTFHLRETEDGEILTIGAIFADANSTFVYDLAAGSVVTLDSVWNTVKTVKLSPIGRNTYMGDDFVVRDSSFIFLNSIDRRLEFFDRVTGTHTQAVPLPADLLSRAKKRSWRTLNRIYLDNGQLMIGNEHYIVAFDPSQGKRRATVVTASGNGNERFVLYRKKGSLMLRNSLIENRVNKATYRQPKTHHTIPGKRVFIKGEKIFAVDAGKDTVRIAEVK